MSAARTSRSTCGEVVGPIRFYTTEAEVVAGRPVVVDGGENWEIEKLHAETPATNGTLR